MTSFCVIGEEFTGLIDAISLCQKGHCLVEGVWASFLMQCILCRYRAGPDAVTKVAGADVTVLEELDAMRTPLSGLACLRHHCRNASGVPTPALPMPDWPNASLQIIATHSTGSFRAGQLHLEVQGAGIRCAPAP